MGRSVILEVELEKKMIRYKLMAVEGELELEPGGGDDIYMDAGSLSDLPEPDAPTLNLYLIPTLELL